MNRATHFAILLAALLAPFTAALAETRAWHFRVFLDEREIGYHRFTLSGEGEARELRSEARFQVRVLGFTAYRYVHEASERWQAGCLRSLASSTDDNGEPVAVDWRAEPGVCAMSFAYWNPKILQGGPLLNAQTGKLEPVTVTPRGEETIELRGRPALAQRYRLSGQRLAIDLWFANREWVALESEAQGGRRLRYRLI
ncbi:MAG: hypothetical protein H7Y16_01135 [Candidatus Parcubacteria bacterium]|nr:hypothetical protein [Burkholderiales bacterium]